MECTLRPIPIRRTQREPIKSTHGSLLARKKREKDRSFPHCPNGVTKTCVCERVRAVLIHIYKA